MNKKLAGIVVGATIVVVAGIVIWTIQNKERGRQDRNIILSILILYEAQCLVEVVVFFVTFQ